MHLSQSYQATYVGPIRKFINPCIIQEELVSPGWTHEVRKTAFFFKLFLDFGF